MTNLYLKYKDLVDTSIEAGNCIMDVFNSDFEVSGKSDGSPVTIADQRAEKIILKHLAQAYSNTPIVAEEQMSASVCPDIADGAAFYLIDPLDGTKEFVNRGTGFTVNIALIKNKKPVLGIIYVPVTDIIYIGCAKEGAIKVTGASTPNPQVTNISVRKPSGTLSIVASLSHMNDETKNYLANFETPKLVQVGSSLKLCLIAEGSADVYPRFGPTMEWDTAAGHAILEAAGGHVLNPDGTPFLYQKTDFRNGYFIATAKTETVRHTF